MNYMEKRKQFYINEPIEFLSEAGYFIKGNIYSAGSNEYRFIIRYNNDKLIEVHYSDIYKIKEY